MAKATYSVAKVSRLYEGQDIPVGGYGPGDIIIVSKLFEGVTDQTWNFTLEEAMEKLEDCYAGGMHSMAIHFEEALRAFEEEEELKTFVIFFEWLD